MAPATLVGRETELNRLRELFARLPQSGSALVLRGEAGIGKSTLLQVAGEMSEGLDLRILRTAGVSSESDLPFSGLQRLLRPILPDALELPNARRAALMAAFGLGDEDGADPFLVGLAALELLAAKAGQQPIVVLVDDLQWLDGASRNAVAFVGRRLDSDPVVLVATLRNGYESEVGELGLPEHAVSRLSDREAQMVVDARTPELDPGLRAVLLAEAAGNPLALVELPTTIERSAERIAGGGTPELSTRLEAAFMTRLTELPQATREVMLVAATDESLEIPELLKASQLVLGELCTLSMIQPAVDVGLATLTDAGLAFRHPLVRSAIYQSASLQRRIAAHMALTEVLVNQPDRRAWHRAAATFGRDDGVAAEVEEMADRMKHRGASLQAAMAYGRSAQLSERTDGRARRLLHAAELAFEVGRADLVRTFVTEAKELTLSTQDRARVELLSEIFHDGEPGDPKRIVALVEIGEQAAVDGDLDLALTILHAAALRSWWGDPGAETRRRVVHAAEAVGAEPLDSRVLTILALAEPVARSGTAIAGLACAQLDGSVDADVLLRLGMTAHAVGDFDRSLKILPMAIEVLREHGRLGLLTHAVGMFASGATFAGDWNLASPAAAEYERLARETDQPIWRAGAAIMQSAVHGVRGDEERAENYAKQAEQLISANASDLISVLQGARGLTALSNGRHEDAYTILARLFDPHDPAHHHREKFEAVGYFADAALLTDRVEHARELLNALQQQAAPEVERALLVGLHHARAVLADDEHADDAFQAALHAISPRWMFNRARVNLAYGIWLRRQRRAGESRVPLRAARDAFDQLNVPPWSDRARRELRAAGESSTRRAPEAWDQLSAQELQIAELAASGLSNREIGQQMYLSHRTVASHLYRIFPKLGITSRSQLNGVLPGDSRD